MKRPQRRGLVLPPALQFALGKGVYLIGLVPPVLLFEHSTQLGCWWVVLLLLYSGGLGYALTRIQYRREMQALRRDLGDEQFFREFPAEWRRECRRLARKERRRARQQKRKWAKLGL